MPPASHPVPSPGLFLPAPAFRAVAVGRDTRTRARNGAYVDVIVRNGTLYLHTVDAAVMTYAKRPAPGVPDCAFALGDAAAWHLARDRSQLVQIAPVMQHAAASTDVYAHVIARGLARFRIRRRAPQHAARVVDTIDAITANLPCPVAPASASHTFVLSTRRLHKMLIAADCHRGDVHHAPTISCLGAHLHAGPLQGVGIAYLVPLSKDRFSGEPDAEAYREAAPTPAVALKAVRFEHIDRAARSDIPVVCDADTGVPLYRPTPTGQDPDGYALATRIATHPAIRGTLQEVLGYTAVRVARCSDGELAPRTATSVALVSAAAVTEGGYTGLRLFGEVYGATNEEAADVALALLRNPWARGAIAPIAAIDATGTPTREASAFAIPAGRVH